MAGICTKQSVNKLPNDSDWSRKNKDLDNLQLSFFQLDDPVLLSIREQLEAIDINALTPVEALMKLNEIISIRSVCSTFKQSVANVSL